MRKWASSATMTILMFAMLAVAPGGLAGSEADPEVTDAVGDDAEGGASNIGNGAADLTAAWIDSENGDVLRVVISTNAPTIQNGGGFTYQYVFNFHYDGTDYSYTVGADGTGDANTRNVSIDGSKISFEALKQVAMPPQGNISAIFVASTGNDGAGNAQFSDRAPDTGFGRAYNLGTQSDAGVDWDGDGIDDAVEFGLGTDPTNRDTDGDKVEDGDELVDGTDPTNPDTDGDGLNDGSEKEESSDPLNPDTDGDGISDGEEVINGTNPGQTDTDGDGIGDKNETDLGLDPRDPSDATADPDGDEVNTFDELQNGTDPFVADYPNLLFGTDIGFDLPGNDLDALWAAVFLLVIVIVALLIWFGIRKIALAGGDDKPKKPKAAKPAKAKKEAKPAKAKAAKQQAAPAKPAKPTGPTFLSKDWLAQGLSPSQQVRAKRVAIEQEIARRNKFEPNRGPDTDLEDTAKLLAEEEKLAAREEKERLKAEQQKQQQRLKEEAAAQQAALRVEAESQKIAAAKAKELAKIQAAKEKAAAQRKAASAKGKKKSSKS